MPGGSPKILRGAFVEYGLSIPPMILPFQFNPEQLSRSRNVYYSAPSKEKREKLNVQAGQERTEDYYMPLKDFHGREEYIDLLKLQEDQSAQVQEESISLDIRFDATDELNDGDAVTGLFGILPRLATLELMMAPKDEGLLGAAVDALLGLSEEGFSFSKSPNPPMILFIWGYTRVLPVNINSMNVTETEFNHILSPTRATVSVSLTVIEGKNIPYMYSKLAREAMSILNLKNIAEVADVIIPS